MKTKKIAKSLFAILLSAGMCISPIALFAEETTLNKISDAEQSLKAEDAIHIKTAEDWDRLAKNCRLDTWSDGKLIVLDNDLKLKDCTPVPSFSGVFDGQNHKIERLELTGNADHQGLFRYIREGAEVKNLTLVGSVTFIGDYAIGGFSGVNAGRIYNCHFKGKVYGATSIGGITGINKESGNIINCTALGSVSGEHYTGGISGENYGNIFNCSNDAEINTQVSDASPEPDDVDWEQINNTENMPACTDTGGIAGCSTGFIQNCINNALIGYPHVGYNVGGIAGRQSGYINSCINNGKVQGRKDVGGIVGQAEPYMLLHYEEDTLQKLSKEIDVLSDLVSDTMSEGNDLRKDVSEKLTKISDLTADIQEHISLLLNEAEDVGEGSAGTVNELSERIADILDDAVPVSDNIANSINHISEAIKKVNNAIDETANMGDQFTGINNTLHSVMEYMQNAFTLSESAADDITMAMNMLQADSSKNLATAIGLLKSGSDKLKQASENARSAFSIMQGVPPQLNGALGMAGNASPEIKKAMEEIQKSIEDMAEASSGLSGIIRKQADLPTLKLPILSEDFHKRQDELGKLLTELNKELEGINQNTDVHGDNLYNDFLNINNQFRKITDILRDANKDRELLIDISEENISDNTPGKIQGSTNNGDVDGNVNIGGIVGAMAIEFDFDPEDDVKNHNDSSLDFQYMTIDILHNSINKGAITARKDYAGGIAGRMDSGITLKCQSYGPVKSSDGKYVGGIAGSSESTIRDCWTKCALSGNSRIGGVGGYVNNVENCHTLVDIKDEVSYIGAIAGECSQDGELLNNVFVSENLAGIDGISYSGKAEPMAYDDFIKSDGVPIEFKSLVIVFTVDDKTLSVLLCDYGGKANENDFPEIPEKEGFYGSWSEFNHDNLLFDTKVEAVYRPYLTAVASDDGKFLAEGKFSPDAKLSINSGEHAIPEVIKKSGGSFKVSISDGENDFTAIRVLVPAGIKHPAVIMHNGKDSWEEVPSIKDGRYLKVETRGQNAEICIVENTGSMVLWIAVLAIILIACIVILIVIAKKHKDKNIITSK